MFRTILVSAALALSSSAFAAATCTSTASLGTMGPPATQTFGNSFNGGSIFSDCWDFSIATAANATGTTAEANASFWFLPRYIDVLSVSLWDLASGAKIGVTDVSPNNFGFTSLAAGTYELVVAGYSTLGFGTASYTATLSTSPAATSTVPEPATVALLALALGAAGFASRKGRLLRS